MRLREQPKPNYKLIRENLVNAKKTTYNNLKKARQDFYNHTFINDNGDFSTLGEYDYYVDKINEAEDVFIKAAQLLVDYDENPDSVIAKLFPETKGLKV